jgi:hypothetical protein
MSSAKETFFVRPPPLPVLPFDDFRCLGDDSKADRLLLDVGLSLPFPLLLLSTSSESSSYSSSSPRSMRMDGRTAAKHC